MKKVKLNFADLRRFAQQQARKRQTRKISADNIVSKLSHNRFLEIDQFIKEREIYLDPTFSLTNLSRLLGLSEGYISQLVNFFSGHNFSNYVNALRVEEAKRLLRDNNYNHYTIVAIGLESGFNSKSTFYAAFKKHTNVSPTTFKNQLKMSG